MEYDLKKLAQDNNINLCDCIEFGTRFLLAEKGIIRYPQNRKIQQLMNRIEKMAQIMDERVPD